MTDEPDWVLGELPDWLTEQAIAAIRTCIAALRPLSPETRAHVLFFLSHLFEEDDLKEPT